MREEFHSTRTGKTVMKIRETFFAHVYLEILEYFLTFVTTSLHLNSDKSITTYSVPISPMPLLLETVPISPIRKP